MAFLGSRASGDIDFGWLPEDIVQRLARRVEQGRLWGSTPEQTFRVVREDEGERHYRQAPALQRSIHVVQDRGRSVFDEMRLSFDGPRVRYDITFSRSRRIGLVAGTLVVSATLIVAGGVSSLEPLFAVGLVGVGVSLALVLSDGFLGTTNAGHQARAAVTAIIRQEIAAAEADARFRIRVDGAASERALAVLAVLDARKVALTDEEQAKILAAPDDATVSSWLARAATATTIDDVLEPSQTVKKVRQRRT